MVPERNLKECYQWKVQASGEEEGKEPTPQGGWRGGPIVNEEGELVGVVSHTPWPEGNFSCCAPFPRSALPVWACDAILGNPVLLGALQEFGEYEVEP